ncbi:DUF3313 domain-containing protein [Geminicoccus harenae]|uniref:DUF3313 domain-containing protein n=1 Tax=Geminicoccus harenae TaxID=2498453 RepID=UPI00168B0ECF|nr:DUF3313 domain-containing protein [Geminicoccus harenae]
MRRRSIDAAIVLAGGLLLAGCQSGGDSGPIAAAPEAAQMRPEPGVIDGWTYRDSQFDPHAYHKVMIDPQAQVYRGAGADYGSLDAQEVQKLAQMLPDETIALLKSRDYLTDTPGPGVLRLRFTVLRISTTVPLAATASRIIPVGAVINLGREAMGKAGSLTGNATILIEVRDSVSDQVLMASQRLVSPGAFDLESTLSTENTARAIAKLVAEEIRTRLDKATGRS